VNHVSEAAVLARRADAAVLVVRDRETSRGAALAARRRLAGMGVPLVGAVLNCAQGEGGGYGYGYGYYYGYGEKGEKA
jgi:Mrp family chromosome partitioning ATPase